MTLVVAGGLALLLFAIPAPHHLNSQGVVWLPDQAHIRAGTSGFVTRVAVPEGTIVAPGELLVETTQPALETDVAKLDWRRRELQAAADSELGGDMVKRRRSEEHTSELQSLMRNSYAVFCLKKKKNNHHKPALE